jgi:HSP20 family protein
MLDNQDTLTLKILVPGIDKKDLDISVTPEAVSHSVGDSPPLLAHRN